MKKLQKSSPSSTDVRSFYPYPTEEPGRNRLIQAVIPADVMNAARKKATQSGATVNDLMIAACYHAYGALESIDPAQLQSTLNAMVSEIPKYAEA